MFGKALLGHDSPLGPKKVEIIYANQKTFQSCLSIKINSNIQDKIEEFFASDWFLRNTIFSFLFLRNQNKKK